MDIMKDVVKLVSGKRLGGFRPRWYKLRSSTDVTFKFYGRNKKLCISVEIFVEWLANKNPPWKAYHTFMSGRLIAFDKKPGIHPVDIGETWRRLFYKCALKVTGPKSTNTCQDDQLCSGLNVAIYGAIKIVKAIWYSNLSK